jgi:hypothetical protein
LEHVRFIHILGIRIPTDFHSIIFQRGRYTTNQKTTWWIFGRLIAGGAGKPLGDVLFSAECLKPLLIDVSIGLFLYYPTYWGL